MPRIAVDDNKRMNLRVRPDQKAALVRAAALRNTDLTDFVLQPALREAAAIIDAADHLHVSARDSLRVLDGRWQGFVPDPHTATFDAGAGLGGRA